MVMKSGKEIKQRCSYPMSHPVSNEELNEMKRHSEEIWYLASDTDKRIEMMKANIQNWDGLNDFQKKILLKFWSGCFERMDESFDEILKE